MSVSVSVNEPNGNPNIHPSTEDRLAGPKSSKVKYFHRLGLALVFLALLGLALVFLELLEHGWPKRTSQKVFIKLFCTSHFPHKSINLFFILVIIKDKLTGSWGN